MPDAEFLKLKLKQKAALRIYRQKLEEIYELKRQAEEEWMEVQQPFCDYCRKHGLCIGCGEYSCDCIIIA